MVFLTFNSGNRQMELCEQLGIASSTIPGGRCRHSPSDGAAFWCGSLLCDGSRFIWGVLSNAVAMVSSRNVGAEFYQV